MAPRSKKIRAPSDYFLWAPQEQGVQSEIRDFRASGIPVGERGEKLPRSWCILLILFFILTVYNGFGDNQNGINSMRRKLQISVRRLLHA